MSYLSWQPVTIDYITSIGYNPWESEWKRWVYPQTLQDHGVKIFKVTCRRCVDVLILCEAVANLFLDSF